MLCAYVTECEFNVRKGEQNVEEKESKGESKRGNERAKERMRGKGRDTRWF